MDVTVADVGWMQTASCKVFRFAAPDAEDVDILDIASALSKTCRFNGHCEDFYSVAQHSVMVSQIVPPEHALAGLLHDAAEAYVGDMVSPLKRAMPAFREVEDAVLAAIFERFGLMLPLPDAVKHADLVMLATEKRDLLGPSPLDWGPLPPPLDVQVRPGPWRWARRAFLSRFHELVA